MTDQLDLFPQEEMNASITMNEEVNSSKQIPDVEWCFQFFNNEPIVFAFSNEGEIATPLALQIEPNEGEGLNFQQNGMVFKIFPRQISEETKLERKNASKNKEA